MMLHKLFKFSRSLSFLEFRAEKKKFSRMFVMNNSHSVWVQIQKQILLVFFLNFFLLQVNMAFNEENFGGDFDQLLRQ